MVKRMGRKISFIIPAYNAEGTIEACILSILCIQNIELEILVVDDGSTDKTRNIINKYASEYKNIFAFSQHNSGPNIARKKGVENAKGEYLFFCDADDTVDAQVMEEIICKIFETQYDIYEFGFKLCYGNGVEKVRSFDKNIINGDDVLLHFLRQKNVTNYLCNKCFKRKIVESIEFVKLYASEDSCDLLQIFAKANSYCSLEMVAYNYIQTENSLCRSKIQIRHLDAVKGNEFKIEYLSRIDKAEYSSYIYVQAMALCAYLYGRLSTSDIVNKKQYMKRLREDFKRYKKKINFNDDAFRVASIKRKSAIIMFSIMPGIFKYITR